MKQRTAKTVEEVKEWIESTPHYQAMVEFKKAAGQEHIIWGIVLNHHHMRFRIPQAIWKECPVKPGVELDARMFRWDESK